MITGMGLICWVLVMILPPGLRYSVQRAAKNMMIVGVGGQGTLLASKLLGCLLLDKGYDVKVSEVHGMSQRGGSVASHSARQ